MPAGDNERKNQPQKPAQPIQRNGVLDSKRDFKDDLPKQTGESYREYMRRLSKTKDITDLGVAAMIATTTLMKSNPAWDQQVDEHAVSVLAKEISRQTAFKQMLRTSKDLELLVSNRMGTELCEELAKTQRAYEAEMEPYQRKLDRQSRERDYEFAQSGKKWLEKLENENKPKDGAEPERNIRQEYFRTRFVFEGTGEATRPAEYNVPKPEECIQLITETRRRIDGEGNVPGGGDLSEDEFTFNMCLLHQYMPPKNFEDYCKRINAHREKKIVPEDYNMERMTGAKKKAEEWNKEREERLNKAWKENKTIDREALAEALAVRQLSRGKSDVFVHERDIQAMKQKLLAPGSAFHRALKDPGEITKELENGHSLDNIVLMTRAEQKGHALGAAQWQINRSVRVISEPCTPSLRTEHLANIIAARELAAKKIDGTEPLYNAGFRERSMQIRNDPAFKRLADKFNNDPQFRAEVNRKLKEDDKATELENQYLKMQLKEQTYAKERDERQKERERRQTAQREKAQTWNKQMQVQSSGSVQIERTEKPKQGGEMIDGDWALIGKAGQKPKVNENPKQPEIQKQQAVSISF